jgi:hypothetical protein
VGKIINTKLIPIDETYYMGLADFLAGKLLHPLNDFYYKADDLSMNIYGSLKWSLWGYKFLKNISTDLKNHNESFQKIGQSANPIPSSINSPINYPVWKEPQLLLDNKLIANDELFINLMNNNYNQPYFDSNSKVHFKLKVNLTDFITLQYELVPIMMKEL